MTNEFKHFKETGRMLIRKGRLLELETIGEMDVGEKFRKELSKILSPQAVRAFDLCFQEKDYTAEERRWINEQLKELREKKLELIELVKKFQKFDPTNPSRDFLKELRVRIQDKLGLTPEKYDSIKSYSSLKSPLDAIGIDGFITWQKNGKEVLVTLDAKLEPERLSAADVVYGEFPDPDEDPDGYEKFMANLSEEVVRKLKRARPLGEKIEVLRANP